MTTVAQDGAGGCLNAISFCDLYHNFYPFQDIDCHLITSEPCFKVIKEFAPEFINLKWYDDKLFNDYNLCQDLKKSKPNESVYCLTPNTYGAIPEFSIDKSGIDWEMVKENRFLFRQYPLLRDNKNVFLALITAQDNNTYLHSQKLIELLCVTFPDYKFFFADVKNWANKNILLNFNPYELKEKFANFEVYRPTDIVTDFMELANFMKYFISVDNGVSNFAYVLGRKRILLDSRFNNLMFKLRWRQTENNLIPIETAPEEVVKVFDLMVNKPYTNSVLTRYLLHPKEQLLQAMGAK